MVDDSHGQFNTYWWLLVLLGWCLALGSGRHVGKDTVRRYPAAHDPARPDRRIRAWWRVRRVLSWGGLRRTTVIHAAAWRRVLANQALPIIGLIIAVIVVIVESVGKRLVNVLAAPWRGRAGVEGRWRRAGNGLRAKLIDGGVDIVVLIVSVYLDIMSVFRN